jgi:hypothetical protein
MKEQLFNVLREIRKTDLKVHKLIIDSEQFEELLEELQLDYNKDTHSLSVTHSNVKYIVERG